MRVSASAISFTMSDTDFLNDSWAAREGFFSLSLPRTLLFRTQFTQASTNSLEVQRGLAAWRLVQVGNGRSLLFLDFLIKFARVKISARTKCIAFSLSHSVLHPWQSSSPFLRRVRTLMRSS